MLKAQAILLCFLLCFVTFCFSRNYYAVELHSSSIPHEIAELHGHKFIRPVGSLEGVYLFEALEDTIPGKTHPHLHKHPKVLWSEKQVPLQRIKRSIDDPLYPSQWHLHGTDINVNVVPVWNQNITGNGVVIGVVDDGLEYDHPDIQPNYRASSSYDFNFHDPSPYPDLAVDTHGTSAAGVAAARDNNACGVGSAFRAGLSGLRILSDQVSDSDEASALSYKPNENFIYSNSWGPIDDGRRLEGPGTLVSRAISNGVETGRFGRGSIYVWAGGNGKMAGDNCNYDGYANSRFTISIGALDYQGNQAPYSENCAMLVVSAPSSGNGKAISTTDLKGTRGSTSSDCRSNFGGTSSSAPLVAGVVALILEANPFLGWRDVQAILIESAIKNAPSDSDWRSNGAGYHINHKFGFGLVNAAAAVDLARQWANLGEYFSISASSSPNAQIFEGAPQSFTVNVASRFLIEHVEVALVITHPRRGDLQISLFSPSSTESILSEQRYDTNANITWTFGSMRHWRENPSGVWTLRITDATQNNGVGTLVSWKLNIYGH